MKLPVVSESQTPLFTPSTLTPEGSQGVEAIRRQCEGCTRCVLHTKRTQIVFGDGNANQPPVCFIGEAPGATEDSEGLPFVGRAGLVLMRMLWAMGLTREEVYLCNVVKCRPENNRPPDRLEIEACSDYLLNQIRAIKPTVLVTLGATATNALLGGKKPIGDLRGKWTEYLGIPLMPTLHPSSIARAENNPNYIEMKKMVWSDLQMVLHKLGRKPPPLART